jgi:hypothetical protein
MLTSLLLVACLPLQDAPAPAPSAAPPAAAPEAAAPTETPENVRQFLVDAEAHLYDPQAAGLTSVEFDLAIDLPPVGSVGNAHVTWTAEGGASVEVSRPADKPLPMGIAPEMADGAGRQMALQLLGFMLNKPITPMLDGGVAAMDGVEDGLVKVRIHNAAAEAQGLEEQALYFDDSGLLQRVRTIAQVESPMGKVKVQQSQTFAWKAAKEGSELVIADIQRSVADMGPMQIKAETSFGYTTVADIVLAISASTKTEVPMQGTITQNLAATNLKVNGTAVGG